jgi:chromosomal replication initiation ATPase DnaA
VLTQEPKTAAEIFARARELRARFFPHQPTRLAAAPVNARRARKELVRKRPKAEIAPFDAAPLEDLRDFQRMRYILRDTLERHDVSVSDLLNGVRREHVKNCRREICYLTAMYTWLSYSRIGRELGVDHTSVRHAVMRSDDLFGTNVHLKRCVK